MMRLTLLVFSSALALLFATPAYAQLNTGAAGYSSAPREGVEGDYYRFLDQIGPCLANQKPEQSLAFVNAVIDSAEEAAAFAVLFNRGRNRRNTCMGRYSGVSGTRAYIRGSVAEGLFEKLDDEVIEAFIANPPAGPESIGTLHDLARCYVVAHPATARELLQRTDVATRGEQAFIEENMSDFRPCMPEGREVTLQPTSLRFAIAEAAFRAATGRPAATIQGRN